MMTSAPGCGDGVAIAVPTDEQKRSRAGCECGDKRERLMRFCNAASWGSNEFTGRAKLTSHAQWIMWVVSA